MFPVGQQSVSMYPISKDRGTRVSSESPWQSRATEGLPRFVKSRPTFWALQNKMRERFCICFPDGRVGDKGGTLDYSMGRLP